MFVDGVQWGSPELLILDLHPATAMFQLTLDRVAAAGV